MKIRYGFVSNSSSTSFCIYGKYFDNNEITEELRENAEKSGLRVINDQNDNGSYIGISFTDIKDNETGKEFKESTLRVMQSVFPELKELSIIEDGWYDG